MDTGQVVLAARRVSKAFFGNPALRDVSIELRAGRIHALLGENGAGKSTLINLLSGTLVPDSGEIVIDGRGVAGLAPREARALGIAVVQQELSLAPHLSIAENIGLGAPPIRAGMVDYARLARQISEVCRDVGLTEPADLPVGRLTLGRRQLVEIAKALYRKPRVLILDEPTSSLAAPDVATLTDLIQRLSARGVAILYISHRLNEILTLCDHLTVLKDGAVAADQPAAGLDPMGLVRLMVGRDPQDLFPRYVSQATATIALQTRKFATDAISDVDLILHRGEILGVGGLIGHGQEDLLLGLYGARSANASTFEVGAAPWQTKPFRDVVQANAAGLAYIPADRKREGLLLSHSIGINLILPLFARRRLERRRFAAENILATSLASRFGIRGDLRRPVQALSGGNQQKVALAKWLPLSPSVLLLNDPTRGVDVETKREIYFALRAMVAEGKAVVLLSSDTPELVHLCDRVMVFFGGRVTATLTHQAASEEAIVAAALGLSSAALPPGVAA